MEMDPNVGVIDENMKSNEEGSKEGGRKFDKDKPRYDLVPPEAIRAIAEALTYGAAKYEPNNWQQLSDFKARYTAAHMRHFEAYRSGELIDEESGLPHLYLGMCNLAFLIWGEEHGACDTEPTCSKTHGDGNWPKPAEHVMHDSGIPTEQGE